MLLVSALAGAASARAEEDVHGFESGTFEGWSTKERCSSDDFAIVGSPTRSGDHAARVQVEEGECDGTIRAEFSRTDEAPDSERWYAWSFYVPEDVETDPDFWIFWQLHQKKGDRDEWPRPPLTGRIRGDGLEVRSDWQTDADEPGENRVWRYGELERGAWHDMVVHARWSLDADGLVEVWQDGELVAEREGPNVWVDGGDIFLKFGVYKGQEANDADKTIYYDDIRASDSEISPRSGS